MRSIIVLKVALAAVLISTGTVFGQTGQTTDQEFNTKLIKRFYDCVNQGNVAVLDQILSDNYQRHEGSETVEGREIIKQSILTWRSAFPDLLLAMTDLFFSDNRAISTWKMTGTHSGALGNIPATGKKIAVTGVIISRISNGRIVEEWAYSDQLQLFSQLGFTLTPPHQSAGSIEMSSGEVIINGSALSKQQINQLEQTYGVKPKPGNYWYDAKSGLYGVIGYQAFGFMRPGHDFGKLERNVSNGNTQVIVNGRELPYQEWLIWSQVLGYSIQQGSYWFDDKGNAGYEGSTVALVNLYAAAQQNAYRGSGGGDNFWTTRFSAGNYDSGNTRGYVSVPGYGPVGYGF